MTPCGMNQITPTMIRNGQINIGDKIILENTEYANSDGLQLASQKAATCGEAVSASGELSLSAADEVSGSAVNAEAVPTAAASVEMSVNAESLSEASAKLSADEPTVIASAVAENENDKDEKQDAVLTSAQSSPAAAAVMAESVPAAAVRAADPLAYGTDSIVRAEGSHNADDNRQPQAIQGGAYPNVQLTSDTAAVQAPPPSWPNRPDPFYYEGEDRNLITFPRMTDYFQDSVNIDANASTPSFTVPSSPMTPPEYTQTLDYDSVQYMNGFLRTQIGRFVRIEQLVGSNTIEDREGFLVGASNNYIILQEIGTGNIMTFDLFSIKFVYIYYEDIPRPEPRS